MDIFETFFENERQKVVYGNTIKDTYEQLLNKLYRVGKIIKIKKPGKTVRTLELIFVNSFIRNPYIIDISDKSRWKSINALNEYSKEIITDIIPEGFNYTYGNLLMHPIDQIERVIKILSEDRNSRQATMMLGDAYSLNMEDPPCCRIVDIKIRDCKVNMTLWFRSHDVTAYPANAYGFAQLQKYIASRLNLECGFMGITGNSLHLYESDCDLIGIKSFDELIR